MGTEVAPGKEGAWGEGEGNLSEKELGVWERRGSWAAGGEPPGRGRGFQKEGGGALGGRA